ncbi:hypothetical protein J2X69_003254 [Algoriphagus sp. 4150]|nr:hypothetical protein [Algoriphagus sp. 4150]
MDDVFLFTAMDAEIFAEFAVISDEYSISNSSLDLDYITRTNCKNSTLSIKI